MRIASLAVLLSSSAWGQSFYGGLRGRVLNRVLNSVIGASYQRRNATGVSAEALNAANTAHFGNPNTTLTNNQFGVISSQINNPRLIQLGARVTF